jgi:hypothetical protein
MMTIVIFGMYTIDCLAHFFVQNDKHVDNIKGGGTHLLDLITSECLRSLIRERSIHVKQIWRQAITYMMFA